MNLANNINTYQTNTDYVNDVSKDYPNVSYIQATDEVKWQATEPIDQEHIVAKYNVTSTSSATKLLLKTTNISKMWIDGVEQPSVQTSYTFSTTGEHIVKYKLSGTNIDDSSFYNCSSLTSVTIPNTVTSIGGYAFYYCRSLTSVTVEATTPPTLDYNAFADTNNCPIYVPSESVNAYKTATNWSSLASRIQPIS